MAGIGMKKVCGIWRWWVYVVYSPLPSKTFRRYEDALAYVAEVNDGL